MTGSTPHLPLKHVWPWFKKLFSTPAQLVVDSYTHLQLYLNAAEIRVEPEDYVLLGFENALFITVLIFAVLTGLGWIANQLADFIVFSTAAAGVMLFVTVMYWLFYPAVQARKKADAVEKDLLFALRDLSIELSAGTPVTDGLNTLTTGYGELSKEMELIVKQVNTGVPLDHALYNSLDRNVGELYQSAILRLVNGIRSGTSIPALLDVVIENLSTKLENAVTAYGENVNTWSTLYLVVGIVMPSMGFTVFVLLSAFTGTQITASLIYLAVFLLVFFHVSAIGLLQSRRPAIEV